MKRRQGSGAVDWLQYGPLLEDLPSLSLDLLIVPVFDTDCSAGSEILI